MFGKTTMSQTERMLSYAKAYADEVVRRNKARVIAIYLSGTLSAELLGKIKGYIGKWEKV